MGKLIYKIKQFFKNTYLLWIALLNILAIILVVLFLMGGNTVC